MATVKFTTVPAKRLSETISGSASTFKLNNIEGWDGDNLVAGDFGTKLYVTFRNAANTLMEIMEIDPATIASTSITILLRGLQFDGDLTTEVSENKLTWIKGDTIVELGTHVPQLLNQTVRLIGDQTVADVKTFSSFPAKSGVTTPAAASDFATKAYVDSVVGGSANYDQNIIPGTAGEILVAGDFVYFKESDSRWWKTDADAVATSSNIKLGFAEGAAAAAASVNILIDGLEKNLSGLTAGSKYYVSGTAGAITTTPGATVRFVGWAITTTRFVFSPNDLEENVIAGVAGESITIGQWVYFKESDQRWWLTDADAATTSIGVQIGVCQVTNTAGNQTLIRISGVDRTQTGLTAGGKYYLSNTAGAIVTTAPTLPRFVGYALGTQQLVIAMAAPFSVDQYGTQVYGASSGGTDTYAITLSPIPVAYFTGMMLRFKADVANTGAATLNVNGLGAKTIKKLHDLDLADNDIEANQIVVVIYDGTNFEMVSQLANPAANLIFKFTTNVVIASSSAENTIMTGTIPGGSLLTDRGVKGKIYLTTLSLINTSTCTIRFKYGGTTLVSRALPNSSGSGYGTAYGDLDFALFATGATNSQEIAVKETYTGMVGDWGSFNSVQVGTSAVDSTADQTFAVTVQFSAADVNNTLTAVTGYLEYLK